MNLKKWIASCYANKNERNCKRLRGFKTYEERILLTFDCVRTVVACKSSRSRASIGSIKLRAWLQKKLTTCTKSLSCMGFDGIQVDAWSLFTVTVQAGQKLRATWTTKQRCQTALYSKKKERNVECHQSLGGQNVCSLFRIAFELELLPLFNWANKSLQAKSSL